MTKQMSTSYKLAISGIIMALYVVILYMTQGISFGAYQVRIATSLYAMSFIYPFLIIPLGLANFIANMIGGLGVLDMVGGCIVGILTTSAIVLIRKFHLPTWVCAVPIIFVPGLGVATWLSYLLNIPYPALALNLCIGQVIPGICGVVLIKALRNRLQNIGGITL